MGRIHYEATDFSEMATDLGQRAARQQAIRHIVRTQPVKTQQDIVAALQEMGCVATQATVSRDIAELKLQKVPAGTYSVPEEVYFDQLAKSLIQETRRAANQVLILTAPGAAQSVAAAIDVLEAEGILGSIAGDDTILVITADAQAGENFETRINKMLESKKK